MSLKIVLAGCGEISGLWFRALKELSGVVVAGLVDLNAVAAEQRKREHGLQDARVGSDLAVMLAQTEADVVFDCTVPVARADVVETALRHGCHVLSEKPMAADMTRARELIAAAERTGRFFAVMQNRRHDGRLRAVRSFLQSGAIGEITQVNGDFQLGAHFEGFRNRMPHVLLLDMAIHTFDQARLLAGADPVAVYCHEWNPRGSWYERDAAAVALFELAGGVVFSYRGSWCAEGFPTRWESEWRIVGTRGSVLWDGGGQLRAQAVKEDAGFMRPLHDLPVPSLPGEIESGHAACIRDFLDCVRTGRVPETICTENIKSLAMVFAAIESAESGRRVML